MKVNEHNLLEALKTLKLDAKVQPETNQIYVIFEHEKAQFPLFIRELHDGELVQLLTFIPCNVDKNHAADLARLLHMLNKELDMPGFCLDETSSTVFYRLMMPTLKKEFQPHILEALINTSQMVCKSFAAVIEALAVGAMSLDEILKKAQQLQQS
ncbi:MAG: YbjN domain-containing protein [Verrucomicrobia bacterium]|nr:YbjN domain-containing protein [Verrucomicrobiota bacterium]MBS0637420.1 YbjN domain-containing protein [Verrucomicrobiota bacterium]